MKWLLLFLTGCSNIYTGVVVSESPFSRTARVKIDEGHYVWINVDTDLIEVGDTVKVDKDNFRLVQ